MFKMQTDMQETDSSVQVLEYNLVTFTARMDRMEATVKDIQQSATPSEEGGGLGSITIGTYTMQIY